MKKIKVEITETLHRVIGIDANTGSNALEIANELCDNEKVILNSDDFVKRN